MEKGAAVTLVLRSLRNFQDEEFAKKIISMIDTYQSFKPDVFDFCEPLKKMFDINQLNTMVDVWMNTESNTKWFDKRYATGQFIAKKNRRIKTSYFVSWTKNQLVNFNLFTLNLNAEELLRSNNFSEFMNMCNDFIKVVNPVHGDIGIVLPNENNPINLRIRCPELKWFTIFGKPYIELFGRERLLSSPCYKVHELDESIVGLQLVESVHDSIPSHLKREIKVHLGEDAFVEEGKGIKRYSSGLAPKFDFTEVLFDSKKPIEEPQIITRKR